MTPNENFQSTIKSIKRELAEQMNRAEALFNSTKHGCDHRSNISDHFPSTILCGHTKRISKAHVDNCQFATCPLITSIFK